MKNLALNEIENLSLGDKRLENRAKRIVERMYANPGASFPDIMVTSSELEGFYRFVENPYVKSAAILEPHIAKTIMRIKSSGDVLLIHDTTEFMLRGQRKDLMFTENHKCSRFFGHCSLAIKADTLEPLGVLRMKTWTRNGATPTFLRKQGVPRSEVNKMPSEQDRWFESINKTSDLVLEKRSLIHVCDSEGDDYALLAKIVAEGARFVIRSGRDRVIEGETGKLREALATKPILAQREVKLSPRERGHSVRKRLQKRTGRMANLQISAGSVTIVRPKLLCKEVTQTLLVNVIYVKELEPREGCEPVEWILLTSESIATPEDILRVVDFYRGRWIIEEYFKALKTGCSYESRQLESYATLQNCLALFIPIAWTMLYLRSESRKPTETSADSILPVHFLDVLRRHTRKPLHTCKEALRAIAALGGHIKNNGDPGWLVLWRGFRKLTLMVQGYLLLNVKQKM